jgi:hypothetical protein
MTNSIAVPCHSEAAELVGRLRGFLERLETLAGGSDRPAGLWLRRAALLVENASWSGLFPPDATPESDELAQTSRELASRCRHIPPSRWRSLVGKFGKNDLEQTLEELAAHLDRVGRHLQDRAAGSPRASTLRAGIESYLTAWRAPNQPSAILANLAPRLPEGLLEQAAGSTDLNERLDRWAALVRGPANSSLSSAQVEGLALACLLLTAAPQASEEWVVEWLGGFGLTGKVNRAPTTPPNSEPGRTLLSPGVLFEWGVPTGIDAWKLLPAPPNWPAKTGGDPPLSAPPLEALLRDALTSKLHQTVEKHRAAFEEWLGQSAGRAWFHRCLVEAVAKPSSAAGAWWGQLRAEGWARSFPDFEVPKGRLFWPEDTPPPWPAVDTDFHASPAGSVIAVERYAPTPAECRCQLSDGPRQPGTPLDRFAEVVSALRAANMAAALADGRYEQGRALAHGSGPGLGDQAIPLAKDWLEALAVAPTTPDAATRAVVLQRTLAALRAWAGAYGLIILPQRWSFGSGCRHDELGAEEATTQLYYRMNDAAGVVFRARRFGLSLFGKLIHQATVSVSVGPAPAGLAEMEELLRPADLKGAEPIRERLRQWRAASLGGYLQTTALQFFVDFYAALGDDLRAGAPDVAARFADNLGHLLSNQFALKVFVPAFVNEYPEDWLQLVPGRRLVTGRVCAVHRPGLKDAQGNLSIPAIVEVE